ncbi:signal peptidase I [Simkania negevensis]|uniref:Signal peptidase I n=1 Tax=Simkania negevensis TaxID=83561 RepID=A0ABS3ASS8_9BACT|nr:signal peptidase I [Simkania negevensis]
MWNKKTYSLRKCIRVMHQMAALYNKKKVKLPQEKRLFFKKQLEQLGHALEQSNRKEASRLAQELEIFYKATFPKRFFSHTFELVIAIVFALFIATIVRQVWFEPYEIPTGSMRPTFKEKDRIVASKLRYGINVPLTPKHLYFDPTLVQRTGIIIFTVEGMPSVADPNTTYFYLFPGKKRLIKRCMGKPGDTLYFYGGKIYGIDREGNEIDEFRSSPWIKDLEYIPFHSFSGEVTTASTDAEGVGRIAYFNQMNLPLGKLTIKQGNNIQGRIRINDQWVPADPNGQKVPHNKIEAYSDFWGFSNFAMARLMTKPQLERLSGLDTAELEQTSLYLELRHHPSVSFPPPYIGIDFSGRIRPMLNSQVTAIPINEQALQILANNLYTGRFFIVKGRASSYREGGPPKKLSPFAPSFSRPIPDGTYEFYYGKAYQISRGGSATLLPPTHPIYPKTPQEIQSLFNLGIGMSTVFEPYDAMQPFYPSRYAYFRDGDLYTMGAPLYRQGDTTLEEFNREEEQHQETSPSQRPYIAFRDQGPPLKDGKIDKDFLQAFGLKVPEKMYLGLGDNHADSADSRSFGFIPEENIRGGAAFHLWPFGNRWGTIPQPYHPWLTLPLVVLSVVLIILIIIWLCRLRKYSKPPTFKD